MSAVSLERVFPPARMSEIGQVAEICGILTEFASAQARAVLAKTDVIVTGWGAPFVDLRVLDAAPGLRAVLHSAGSVKAYVDPEVLEHGVQVSSAAAANAVPVAEYAVAMIVLAGKRALPIAAHYRAVREAFDVEAVFPRIGNYGNRIGIVGASKIGRLVIGMLRTYELEVVVYDPFLTDADAAALGVRSVSLDELLATSDVVSVHAPSLSSTIGLIDRRGIGLMRPGTALLNTARGEIIDQAALTERVIAGEITAILDVTTPEVLDADDPLFASDHALITPHIAGSMGRELGRLARSVRDELMRLSAGEPLAHAIDGRTLAITA
ncbi:hydroxyacid dehydrogenase [Microbacterium sp. MAH-37]|nr:hydroxyacid dehydrogenase [Microbacterium sp. MAH-37]MVQ42822.1 hydroxyacid dehydrogenase [Microbacterium sp. MAH-37]